MIPCTKVKKEIPRRFSFIMILIIGLLGSLYAQTITTGTLVKEMVDMTVLAEFPDPTYESVQFSSYDRRSTHPDAPGWFANSDGFGHEPIPGFEKVLKEPGDDKIGEYLMCDIQAPGAIVRLWTARIEGNIRLFLDDLSKPFYEGPAQPFFLHTYQTLIPELSAEAFQGTFSQNMAGYYPIPFAKRCRIEWIGNLEKLHFYHIGVRIYEKGTSVKTFSKDDLNTYNEEINHAASLLANPVHLLTGNSNQRKTDISIEILPGEVQDILTLRGEGAIEQLTLKISASDLDKALRNNILNISFDGSAWGQIQSPVGDFFGAAPGINPYHSVPFSVKPDGTMICRYKMPYRDSMKLSIQNKGKDPVFIVGNLICSPNQWIDGKTMYFRARWRVDHNILSSNTKPYDIPYLVAQGKGVVVGAAAMLMNPSNVPSSWGNWWGEGDEKIFLDDDTFPSFFGTGSEDYYNYAWSSSAIFAYGFCGQPRNDGPANRGFVTNYRYHILDPIPFVSKVAFYMELLSHGPVPGFSYGRIVYHYGLPGLVDDHLPLTDQDVVLPLLPENWMPIQRYYTANAEFFQAEEIVTEDQEFSLEKGAIWSGGKILVSKSEQINFEIPTAEDGEFVVVFTARRAPGSGTLEAEIDGETIMFGDKSVIYLDDPYRILSRNFVSTPVALGKGDHKLTLMNKSDPQKPIGIDFIWLIKR